MNLGSFPGPARLAPIAMVAWAVSCTPLAVAAQAPPATTDGFSRELSLHGGVMLAPPAIGRDVAAGGDTLIAGLGNGGLLGVAFELRNDLLGLGVGLIVGPRSITVTSVTGVEFPRHGQAPGVYVVDGRLYPFGWLRASRRVSPYLAVGGGGAFVSVDLDNVDGQELRNLWMRGAAAGVKVRRTTGPLFVDVYARTCRLSGRGPITPFSLHAFGVAIGTRY